MGDELFDLVAPSLLARIGAQRVIATGLARLHALEGLLAEGFDRAVWVDADVLMLEPVLLTEGGALFGREIWIQLEGRRTRVHRKIHNSFMAFRSGDPVLPFYRYAAQRILARHHGPMAPQLIGPKLLSLLHNASGFGVIESAGMLSPSVARDLLAGGGPSLARFRRESADPGAVNLCGSLVGREGLDHADVARLVDLLQRTPGVLSGD